MNENKLISTKDSKWMIMLTAIFAVLVFFRLGNTYAPETGVTYYSEGNHEIILDMGDYIDVANIDIFLNNYHERKVALSAYNEVTEEWQIINDDMELKSVFRWNRLETYYYLRYIGIVFLDDKASINEIVCLDDAGNILTPVNASEYPELFDEQDKHPDISSYMDSTMFDEIYHGRTAYEFVHHLTTYETTHPHLGKAIIAIGVKLFGMNPFGWRVMVALFGIFMVPLMYYFGKRITKNTNLAIVITTMLVCEFSHFTLARIATIDTIVGFFILLMYYFMFAYLQEEKVDEKKAYWMLCLSGVAMSLGVATKFTGIYAGAGLGVIFIIHTLAHFPKDRWKKLLGLCVIFFIIIPIIVYSLPFLLVVEYNASPNFPMKVINCTRKMIEYHANLESTHYYSSPWYTWPLDWKPLLLTHDVLENGNVSAASVMGNPFIWWTALPCIVVLIYRSIRYKDKTALFLVASYAFQYLPWALVPRICFIYHYYPCALFCILIIGYTLKILIEKYPKANNVVIIYTAIVVIGFIAFYPAISGVAFQRDYILYLKWLPAWVLTL